MESPRKGGRNRTDTMVFSDAEAFSEALRGHSGSPTSFSLSKDASSTSPPHSAGFDSGGIPHVDSLQVLAQSSETCRPHTLPEKDDKDGDGGDETEQEAKPYTLTFSASGTMKTALPPGVSPSSSAAGGLGLAPSPLQVPSSNGNFTASEMQQPGNNPINGAPQFSGFNSLRPPAYSSSGPFEDQGDMEYRGGEDVVSRSFAPGQRLAEVFLGGKLDEILPLRRGLLEGRMADVELRETGGDEKEGEVVDGAVDEVAVLDKAVESAKREEEGEFVVISADSEESTTEKDGPAQPEPAQSHEDDASPGSEPATEVTPKSSEEIEVDEIGRAHV